jgi:hypothetical protein
MNLLICSIILLLAIISFTNADEQWTSYEQIMAEKDKTLAMVLVISSLSLLL